MLAALTAFAVLQGGGALTADETKAGWRLLFDGKTTKGWHNFRGEGVKPGWVVKDGVLVCADPANAGDIVTDEKFEWFELSLEYNLTKGGNSGIMFHVADDGDATWHSGPEIQLYDHQEDANPQKTGWLYELYSSPTDSTKPAGEWNQMRILVTAGKCETYVNGVKYYEYVLGSEDFKARLAKSKFAEMPNFAKVRKGSIAIQGDHGVVSFRNIKVRPIK
ncbi:MAG: 3-keto-disaccharide hydrolase [Fimbriimonas sp.]